MGLKLSSFLIAVVTLTLCVYSPVSQAGMWLQTALTASQAMEQTGTQTTAKTTRFIDATSLGYHFKQGFFLGGQLLFAKSLTSNCRTWAAGPKGGLLLDGFELTASFLPLARDSGGSAALRKGAGFAVNMGYSWRIWGAMRAGIQGTYWTVTLNDEGGERLNPKQKISYLTPQFSLGFDF